MGSNKIIGPTRGLWVADRTTTFFAERLFDGRALAGS
jgi:hypothetical protein